jgi:hypothetical protein
MKDPDPSRCAHTTRATDPNSFCREITGLSGLSGLNFDRGISAVVRFPRVDPDTYRYIQRQLSAKLLATRMSVGM